MADAAWLSTAFTAPITGAGSFYDPATLCRGNTYITPENDPGYQPESFYYTDAINDNAIRFIGDHCGDNEASDKPFFPLCLPHQCPLAHARPGS
jgi:arylsulfatase